MPDNAMSTEQLPVSPALKETNSGRWGFLKSLNPFSRKNTQSSEVSMQPSLAAVTEQRKEAIQIPPESGYAKWIKELTEKNDPTDLTANELTRLYPHLVLVLKKPELKVDAGGREELLELLNSGNVQTVVRLAEVVRDNYSKGQPIAALRKRSNSSLANFELEAVLADQLVHRLQRQKQNTEEIPSVIINSTKGIDLDPDHIKE